VREAADRAPLTEVGQIFRMDSEPAERVIAGGDGVLEFAFDLPMPGVSCLELVP
jgi:hypothetical protein